MVEARCISILSTRIHSDVRAPVDPCLPPRSAPECVFVSARILAVAALTPPWPHRLLLREFLRYQPWNIFILNRQGGFLEVAPRITELYYLWSSFKVPNRYTHSVCEFFSFAGFCCLLLTWYYLITRTWKGFKQQHHANSFHLCCGKSPPFSTGCLLFFFT